MFVLRPLVLGIFQTGAPIVTNVVTLSEIVSAQENMGSYLAVHYAMRSMAGKVAEDDARIEMKTTKYWSSIVSTARPSCAPI